MMAGAEELDDAFIDGRLLLKKVHIEMMRVR